METLKFLVKVVVALGLGFGLMMMVIMAMSCASAPTPKPIQVPTAALQEPTPCEQTSAVYCLKGEHCGAWTFESCFTQLQPSCNGVTSITQQEADLCSAAIMDEPCDGSFPDECRGIAGEPTL
jgi:hypothetical protein